MPLHAGHGTLVSKVGELEGEISAMEVEGVDFEKGLQMAQVEYAKKLSLMKPDSWLDDRLVFFSGEDRGTSSVTVQYLIDAYEQDFLPDIEVRKEFIASVSPNVDSPQAGVKEALEALNTKVASTEAAGTQYRSELGAAEVEFKHIVSQVHAFSSKATEFIFAVDDLEEDLATFSPSLVTSLAVITEMLDKFSSETRVTMNTITDLYTDIDTVARELLEKAETSDEAASAFNRVTLNDLYERFQTVDTTTDAREAELGVSAGEEQEKEEMRVQFATMADEFRAYTVEKTSEVANLDGDLEAQLATFVALKEEYDGVQAERLAYLEGVAGDLQGKGVISNPHTNETIYSVQAVWGVLKSNYDRAENSLRGQILARESGGITPEQYVLERLGERERTNRCMF